MKKLIFFSFLIFSGTINAQWVQQHSNAYQYYNTIFFIDSLNGFVGGYPYPETPFILKTTDGGNNWAQSDINGTPASLSFANNNLGFCAAFNAIYKTTDSGLIWNLNYQDGNHFNSIEYINDTLAYALAYTAVSNDVYFYKTQDGGNNWSNVFIGTDLPDSKIEMLNELDGFIIANSKIFRTNDGGDNWQIVYEDTASAHSFWAISFWDNLNGLAAGAGTGALITSDGGNTWNKIFLPLTFCTNIQMIENHCWVSGFGIGYNAIIYSNNYGETWTPIFVGDSISIQDIFFSNLNNGWYCSNSFYQLPFYNGFIYKIENDWLSQISIPSTPQQIYPANNANFEQVVVDFEWEKLNYSLTRFQVSTDSLFNSFYVLINYVNGDTSFFGNQLYIENNKTVAFPLDQKYYWRVRSENLRGVSDWSETRSFTTSSPTSVGEETIPDQMTLNQNYPNPFNPSTKISWQSPISSWQTLRIYDVLGNQVTTLVNEFRTAGKYEASFDTSGLPSGIYFYKLQTGSFVETKKMTLLK